MLPLWVDESAGAITPGFVGRFSQWCRAGGYSLGEEVVVDQHHGMDASVSRAGISCVGTRCAQHDASLAQSQVGVEQLALLVQL